MGQFCSGVHASLTPPEELLPSACNRYEWSAEEDATCRCTPCCCPLQLQWQGWPLLICPAPLCCAADAIGALFQGGAHLSFRRAPSSTSVAVCGGSGAPLGEALETPPATPRHATLSRLMRALWAELRGSLAGAAGRASRARTGQLCCKCAAVLCQGCQERAHSLHLQVASTQRVSGSSWEVSWERNNQDLPRLVSRLCSGQGDQKEGGLTATDLEVAGLALATGDQCARSPEFCKVSALTRYGPQGVCMRLTHALRAKPLPVIRLDALRRPARREACTFFRP